jgi:hypothetical protein
VSTECYSMIRSAGLRVTGLTARGAIPDPIQFATSKSVSRVQINEVTEGGSNDLLRVDETDEPRIRLRSPDQTIRYTTDNDFLRVDPGVFNLVSGVPLVTNAAGVVVGFDANTRLPAATFALEVWSRLAGQPCDPSGARLWGYTLLSFLRGGVLSGFVFSNGVVSFNLRGAQTRKNPRWGSGPFDLEGSYERLLEPVSRNKAWKTFITSAQPPSQGDGVQETTDVIDGGTATMTPADIVDGEFVDTSVWIEEGGRAV